MITELTTWYTTLPPMMQIFWGCAIISSLVFLLQLLLTMIGMDSNSVDIHFDATDLSDPSDTTLDTGGGLSLFSIRNLINFLLGFGWAGVSLAPYIGTTPLLPLISLVVGILFVLMFFYIRKQTLKLETNGAFDITHTLHKTATVYLRIPPQRKGRGKIQITQNGTVQEIDAITDQPEIPSGTPVRILEIIDRQTVCVQRISQ